MTEKHLQSVLFPKDKFTQKKAEEWMKKHKLIFDKVDLTQKFLRYRQEQPWKNAKFVNHILPNDIELVLQYHEPQITIQKSDDKKHKYQAIIKEGDKTKIVRFGAIGYDDYTTHHDRDRMILYTNRHIKEKQFWSYQYDNLFKPSFWAKNLLWNDETSDLKKSSQIISKSLGYSIKLDI